MPQPRGWGLDHTGGRILRKHIVSRRDPPHAGVNPVTPEVRSHFNLAVTLSSSGTRSVSVLSEIATVRRGLCIADSGLERESLQYLDHMSDMYRKCHGWQSSFSELKREGRGVSGACVTTATVNTVGGLVSNVYEAVNGLAGLRGPMSRTASRNLGEVLLRTAPARRVLNFPSAEATDPDILWGHVGKVLTVWTRVADELREFMEALNRANRTGTPDAIGHHYPIEPRIDPETVWEKPQTQPQQPGTPRDASSGQRASPASRQSTPGLSQPYIQQSAQRSPRSSSSAHPLPPHLSPRSISPHTPPPHLQQYTAPPYSPPFGLYRGMGPQALEGPHHYGLPMPWAPHDTDAWPTSWLEPPLSEGLATPQQPPASQPQASTGVNVGLMELHARRVVEECREVAGSGRRTGGSLTTEVGKLVRSRDGEAYKFLEGIFATEKALDEASQAGRGATRGGTAGPSHARRGAASALPQSSEAYHHTVQRSTRSVRAAPYPQGPTSRHSTEQPSASDFPSYYQIGMRPPSPGPQGSTAGYAGAHAPSLAQHSGGSGGGGATHALGHGYGGAHEPPQSGALALGTYISCPRCGTASPPTLGEDQMYHYYCGRCGRYA